MEENKKEKESWLVSIVLWGGEVGLVIGFLLWCIIGPKTKRGLIISFCICAPICTFFTLCSTRAFPLETDPWWIAIILAVPLGIRAASDLIRISVGAYRKPKKTQKEVTNE